jgi:hypothetical protein
MTGSPSRNAAVSAPVYRNLEARNTLLGLAFPAEWGGLLVVGWTAATLGAPNLGAAASLGIYTILRIAGRTRPEGYIQHFLLWKMRQAWTGGMMSAAARARVPRFPFGRHEWRETAVDRGA